MIHSNKKQLQFIFKMAQKYNIHLINVTNYGKIDFRKAV
jgi:hypothetical protein